MSDKHWVAHIKGDVGSYEISVCYGKPDNSWGWFGPTKMRIEGGSVEYARARAEKIAAALNAAAFDPSPDCKS